MGIAFDLGFPYGRLIFEALDDHVLFAAGDIGDYSDNSLTLSYLLRDVTVNGRRILLGGVIVNNVCSLE